MYRVLVEEVLAGEDCSERVVMGGVGVNTVDVQVGRVCVTQRGYGPGWTLIWTETVLEEDADTLTWSHRQHGSRKASIVQACGEPYPERQAHRCAC
eukprot:1312247-Prymnesium_polylepis.1